MKKLNTFLFIILSGLFLSAQLFAQGTTPCGATALAAGTNPNGSLTDGSPTGVVLPEPTCANHDIAAGCVDGWYQITVVAGESFELELESVLGTDRDVGAEVYVSSDGTCSGTFTALTCANEGTGTFTVDNAADLTQTTYWVRTWDFSCNADVEFTLDLTIFNNGETPCTSTALAVGANGPFSQDDPADQVTPIVSPNPACGSHTTANGCVDRWYSYTTTAANEMVTVSGTSMEGTDRDVGIEMYISDTDCGGNLTALSCDNEGTGLFSVSNTTMYGIGTTFWFRVWDFSCNADITYDLNIAVTSGAAATNDEPCTATALTSGIAATGSLTGATQTGNVEDPMAPCTNGSGATGFTPSSTETCEDVWFSFTVPADGVYDVYTDFASSGDLQLAVYSGASCSSLSFLSCDSDGGSGVNPMLGFGGLAGEVIYIRVWEFNCNDITASFDITVEPATEIKLDAATTGTTVDLNCGAAPLLFTDSGGAGTGAPYQPNEDYDITFSAPAGNIVVVYFIPYTGSTTTALTNDQLISLDAGNEVENDPDNRSDYIFVYDGAPASVNQLYSFTGNSGSQYPQPGVITSSGTDLSFGFLSTQDLGFEGFAAYVTCMPAPAATSVSVDCATGLAGESEALTGRGQMQIFEYCPSAAYTRACLSLDLNITANRNSDLIEVYDADAANYGPSNILVTYSGNASDSNDPSQITSSDQNATGCLTVVIKTSDLSPGWTAGSVASYTADLSCAPCRLGDGGQNDCADATEITANGTWVGSNTNADGDPWNSIDGIEPSISLTDCSPAGERITIMENSVWYTLTTPANACGGTSLELQVENFSCYTESASLGAQIQIFELVDVNGGCPVAGAEWVDGNHASLFFCQDNLSATNPVSGVPALNLNSTYYILFDGFTGQKCNWDLQVTGFPSDFDGDGICDIIDIDDDNDGIPDVVELGCTAGSQFGTAGCYPDGDPNDDSDGDGILNYADGDYTGCSTPNDPYGDNLNFNFLCGNMDPDNDGHPSHLDLDADDDGIADIIEAGGVDADNDGHVDYPVMYDPSSMTDADGDGLSDDNIYDSNNDGTADSPADLNTADVPGTGTTTTGLPVPNTDGDASNLYDFLDLDSDDDGLTDLVEAGGNDADGDGQADYWYYGTGNPDQDNDGWVQTYDGHDEDIRDGVSEGTPLVLNDSDNDGIPDHLDLDSDNDGIPDTVEAGGTDANGDGMIDCPVGTDAGIDNDGLCDSMDPVNNVTFGSTGVDPQIVTDFDEYGGRDEFNLPDGVNNEDAGDPVYTDGDAADGFDPMADEATATDGSEILPNWLDLDSDNDGCFDTVEADNSDNDTNDDGIVGATSPIVDTDGDGWSNITDMTNGGTPLPNQTSTDVYDASAQAISCCRNDNDNDLICDDIDIDDDNDGIPDLIEHYLGDDDNDGTPDYMDPDYCMANFNGVNGWNCANGLPDPSGDLDGDGTPNYEDPDFPTCGGLTADGVCKDLDNDLDGITNHLDLDADNDGIPDIVEAGGNDSNNDGLVDDCGMPDCDADNDGLLDPVDTNTSNPVIATTHPLTNTDNTNGGMSGDHLPDFLDLDADDDGIPDLVESGGPDTNNDGMVDGPNCILPAGCQTDANTNGWADNYDAGSPLIDECVTCDASVNPDGDGAPNHLDLDSDDDGCFDTVEADVDGSDRDTNMDGIVVGTTPIVDANGNGWSSSVDPDDGGTVLPNTNPATDVYTNAAMQNSACNNLPLDLVSFSGVIVDCEGVLKWATENEVNVSHFEVQKSEDGQTFEVLGRINAQGGFNTTNYSFTDRTAKHISYYRLKMIDLDGSFSISDVVNLKSNCYKDTQVYDIYPNPAMTSINYELFSGVNGMARIIITDVIGRDVMNFEEQITKGLNVLNLDVQALADGVYILRVEIDGTPSNAVRFVKE